MWIIKYGSFTGLSLNEKFKSLFGGSLTHLLKLSINHLVDLLGALSAFIRWHHEVVIIKTINL